MKRLFYPLVFLAMISAVNSVVVAETSGLEGVVRNLEQRRIQAMIDVDVPTLEAILDSSLTYTHSTGLVQARQQLVDLLVAGDVVYNSVDTENVAFRQYGNTVVVTGKQTIQLTVGGNAVTSKSRFTFVYVATGGEDNPVRMVAYQSTALPKLMSEQR